MSFFVEKGYKVKSYLITYGVSSILLLNIQMIAKDMIDGGKLALGLVLFVVAVLISLLINSSVGLFVGGSLEQASTAANFSTEVQSGFTTVIGDFITNVTALNDPVSFFITLVLVIMVIAVFYVFIYMPKNKGDKDGGMGY